MIDKNALNLFILFCFLIHINIKVIETDQVTTKFNRLTGRPTLDSSIFENKCDKSEFLRLYKK